MKFVSSLKITNSSNVNKTLCLEPWAEEFEMYPKETLEVVIKSGEDGEFEVDFSESRITVFAWWNSVAEVLRDGENICGSGHMMLSGPKNNVNLSNSIKWLFGKD